MTNHQYSLSASKLNAFREDPLGFWLAEKKIIAKPDDIFPTITRGVDAVMKNYLDRFRGALPPHLEGVVQGTLYPNPDELKKWRHWQSGLKARIYVHLPERSEGILVQVIGALDDLLVEYHGVEDLRYSPLDNKSKGNEPKDDGRKYYQTQCDVYALLLRENKMTPSGRAYLSYAWPVECHTPQHDFAKPSAFPMQFDSKTFEIEADADRAVRLLEEVVACLESETPPVPTSGKLSGWGEAYREWKGNT